MQFQMENKGIDLNLYDLNKSIVSQLEPLTIEEMNEKIGLIKTYMKKGNINSIIEEVKYKARDIYGRNKNTN